MFEERFCLVNAPAGIWFGVVVEASVGSVLLKNARNVFSWEGAFTISELAVQGTVRPNECRVPRAVSEVWLLNPECVIPCTPQAEQSLTSLPVWTADRSKQGITKE